MILVFAIITATPAWASNVIPFQPTRPALKSCAVNLVTKPSVHLGEHELLQKPWIRAFINPADVYNLDFDLMGDVNGGTYGLLIAETKAFDLKMHAVILDRSGALRDHDVVFSRSGEHELHQYEAARVDARQAVRDMMTSRFAKTVDASHAEVVVSDPSVLPEPSRAAVLSAAAEYAAVVRDGRIEVRDLATFALRGHFTLQGPPSMVYPRGVSADGRHVSLIVRADPMAVSELLLVDVVHHEVVLAAPYGFDGYPEIHFFPGGWSLLEINRIRIFENGQVTKTFPIVNATLKGNLQVMQINRPGGVFYESKSADAVIFSNGPQPVRTTGSAVKIFDDVRAKDAQAMAERSINDFDAFRAADTYEGLFDGMYAVSGDGRWIAQMREKGSIVDLQLEASVVLWDGSGKVHAVIHPFWTIGGVALSADGEYLAIAENFSGPSEVISSSKRVWIYRTEKPDVPVVAIEEVELSSTDSMRFTRDNRRLFIESINSKKVVAVDLPPLGRPE